MPGMNTTRLPYKNYYLTMWKPETDNQNLLLVVPSMKGQQKKYNIQGNLRTSQRRHYM